MNSQVFYPGVTIEREVMIPMRDGMRLCADIYRPVGVDDLLPVLLMRLPYGRTIASTVTYRHPSWYAAQGYLVVIQEVRGCGRSEGAFYPFFHEYEDGEDTVHWCVDQLPGSNGRVGMYGFSYQGVTQFQAAVMAPRGLITLCPAMATADFFEGWFYFGGALCWEFVLTWALQLTQLQAHFRHQEPLATHLHQAQQLIAQILATSTPSSIALLTEEPLSGFYLDWLNARTAEAWKELNPLTRFDRYSLPALHIGGWFDPFIAATWNTYRSACAATTQPQKLVIGPWQHMPWRSQVGELDFGKAAARSIDQLQIDWFDFWLKGKDNGIAPSAPSQFFLMGENRWIAGDTAPSAHRIFYLQPDASLAPTPTPATAPDIYIYDPRIPTPCSAYGPYDQRPFHRDRTDRLIYRSAILLQKLAIQGIVECILEASTTVPDTDWVMKLLDIYPDGREILVTMGVLRTSLSGKPILSEQPRSYRLECRPTCHTFALGHRWGICIASAAFPLIERHSNTWTDPSFTHVSEWQEATQLIYHTSHVKLPLLQP